MLSCSVICQSGRSPDALEQAVSVSVVDTSQSTGRFDIRGSALSLRNFAYKVNCCESD